ncbi:hypothetical protein GCM10010466_31020 [Planomonospora alba]|uniref:Putative lipoprotein n=1 Tax=Planomonospora alba TaxID=161354 RepID=R4ZC80_9ACTN|nr:putative lipoprotein [Planomonospora alba]
MTDEHRRPATASARAAAAAPILAGAALLLTACGGSGQADPATREPVALPSPTAAAQQVSERNFGYTWPLTVDHGTAECRDGDRAVFTAPDGTTYALNERAREAGYAAVDPVRLSGEGGGKVSLGPLLSRTMKLCRFAR